MTLFRFTGKLNTYYYMNLLCFLKISFRSKGILLFGFHFGNYDILYLPTRLFEYRLNRVLVTERLKNTSRDIRNQIALSHHGKRL